MWPIYLAGAAIAALLLSSCDSKTKKNDIKNPNCLYSPEEALNYPDLSKIADPKDIALTRSGLQKKDAFLRTNSEEYIALDRLYQQILKADPKRFQRCRNRTAFFALGNDLSLYEEDSYYTTYGKRSGVLLRDTEIDGILYKGKNSLTFDGRDETIQGKLAKDTEFVDHQGRTFHLSKDTWLVRSGRKIKEAVFLEDTQIEDLTVRGVFSEFKGEKIGGYPAHSLKVIFDDKDRVVSCRLASDQFSIGGHTFPFNTRIYFRYDSKGNRKLFSAFVPKDPLRLGNKSAHNQKKGEYIFILAEKTKNQK